MPAGTEPLQLFDTGQSQRIGGRTALEKAELVSLAETANRTRNPLERARILVRLGSATNESLEIAIAEARAAGTSWRQLAARLGVPSQTLHRRYRLSRRETVLSSSR